MEVLELVGGAIVLLVMLGVGTVAHEMTHAIVLHLFGISYDVEWFPESDAHTHYNVGIYSAWASVTPRSVPQETPAWTLQLSAIAPLILATPFVLVFAGVLPNPLDAGSVLSVAAIIAWLGCALPSPQDFSLFWYADDVVSGNGELLSSDRCDDIHNESSDSTVPSGEDHTPDP